MIGRLYTVAIGGQAQTGAKTLIEIAAPDFRDELRERAHAMGLV